MFTDEPRYATSDDALRHLEFEHSGRTWRIIFQRSTAPRSKKHAAGRIEFATRRVYDAALRVWHKGHLTICGLGQYVPGRGIINMDVLRDDIGPDIDMEPIIKYAGTLYDKCRTDGTNEYTSGASCANPETLRLCPVCYAVRVIYSNREMQRSHARRYKIPLVTEEPIEHAPLPERPGWCATATYPKKLTASEYERLAKALRLELVSARVLFFPRKDKRLEAQPSIDDEDEDLRDASEVA